MTMLIMMSGAFIIQYHLQPFGAAAVAEFIADRRAKNAAAAGARKLKVV